MPEGDTIAWAANRIRPVLEGRVPDEILTPHPRHAMDRWPERLAGRRVEGVDSHGKHLFIRFDGNLTLHSHLGMSGKWLVSGSPRPWRRAWIVLRAGDRWVVELDGPLLELMTDSRSRFDQRLAALGPDVLAERFDRDRFLSRLHSDDPTRSLGDALLDQRNVAGIGNIWKAEGCWEAEVDPWRQLSGVSDEDALAVIEAVRPRMLLSATHGPRAIDPRVYNRAGRPCPRCGTTVQGRAGGYAPHAVRARRIGAAPRPPAGEANRTTYWCPRCQR
ncbi:MAG: DNA-formamidopyrimidine glycosylase family protein [Solirubrobacteraceae bacterium]